jgi:hypothetical protein
MTHVAVMHRCQTEYKIGSYPSDLVGVAGFEPTAPRSQSPGRPCAAVCACRITCANAVAKLARDGCGRRSLLHGCYTDDLDGGAGCRPSSWLPGTGTQNLPLPAT